MLVLFLILSYSRIQILTVKSWIQLIEIFCLILSSDYCFQDLVRYNVWKAPTTGSLPSFLAYLKSKRGRKEFCLVIVSVQISPDWDAETGVQAQVVCLGNSGDNSREVIKWHRQKGDNAGHLISQLLEEFNTIQKFLETVQNMSQNYLSWELRELWYLNSTL